MLQVQPIWSCSGKMHGQSSKADAKDVKKHSVTQADTCLIKLYLKTIEINNHKAEALMRRPAAFSV